MNKLIVLSIVFIMAGCVSFPKPQESVLLGECFQLQQAKLSGAVVVVFIKVNFLLAYQVVVQKN